MAKHNVAITTGPRRPCFEIDGHDIAHGLREATIRLGSGGETHIEVEIAASVIDVMRLASPDAEVLVSLPPGARDALIALGWTPPASDTP